MAKIKNAAIRENEIMVTLSLSREEWELVQPDCEGLVVFPLGKLTATIRSGEQNSGRRFFLSNGMMEKHNVRKEMPEKLPMSIISINGSKILCIALQDKKEGVPQWEKQG